MSDIGLNFGNFFDVIIGGAILFVALILLVCGAGFRLRWLSLSACILAAGTAMDFVHSLSYATPDQPFWTGLLTILALGVVGTGFWAFVARRRIAAIKHS